MGENLEIRFVLLNALQCFLIIFVIHPPSAFAVSGTKTCGSILNNTFIKIGNVNGAVHNNGTSKEPVVKLCYPILSDGRQTTSNSEFQNENNPKVIHPQFSSNTSNAESHSTWNDTSGVFVIDKTQNRSQEITHGIILGMTSCLKYLPTQSVSLSTNSYGHFNISREKPFALVHGKSSKCKCQYYLLTETTELRVESLLWIVNGILIKSDTLPNHYCLRRGVTSQNRIYSYSVTGIIDIQPTSSSKNKDVFSVPCDGICVPPLNVQEMWTESNHPCGKVGYDLATKSPGSSICLVKPEKDDQLYISSSSCGPVSVSKPISVSTPEKIKIRPLKKSHKKMFRSRRPAALAPRRQIQRLIVNELPPTCGPVGAEIDPALCRVKCHQNGLIRLPGGCHMYGRCYLKKGEFFLYVLKCPPRHRFHPLAKRCVLGSGNCLKQETSHVDSFLVGIGVKNTYSIH